MTIRVKKRITYDIKREGEYVVEFSQGIQSFILEGGGTKEYCQQRKGFLRIAFKNFIKETDRKAKELEMKRK